MSFRVSEGDITYHYLVTEKKTENACRIKMHNNLKNTSLLEYEESTGIRIVASYKTIQGITGGTAKFLIERAIKKTKRKMLNLQFSFI